MPRGGRRGGTPGKAYPNRSDLQTAQPVSTVPNQPYGQAGQQAEAQKVAPLAGKGAGMPPPPAAAGGGQGPMPPQMGPPPKPLDAPTDKPGQPLMAGAPIGPGPGPEALPNVQQPTDVLGLFLREMYRAEPSEDIRQLIQQHEMNSHNRPPAPTGPAAPPGMPPSQGVPVGPSPSTRGLPQTGPMGGPPMRPPAQGVPPGETPSPVEGEMGG